MNEMSFLFLLNLCATLSVAHQVIGLMVVGNTPINMGAEMLGVSKWQLYGVQLLSITLSAAMWMVVPTWVMVVVMVLGEVAAVRQLLKWRKILNERRS